MENTIRQRLRRIELYTVVTSRRDVGSIYDSTKLWIWMTKHTLVVPSSSILLNRLAFYSLLPSSTSAIIINFFYYRRHHDCADRPTVIIGIGLKIHLSHSGAERCRSPHSVIPSSHSSDCLWYVSFFVLLCGCADRVASAIAPTNSEEELKKCITLFYMSIRNYVSLLSHAALHVNTLTVFILTASSWTCFQGYQL